jgi:hypothetical protein
MSFADSVKTVTGEFSRIFRHLIPGVIIMGLSYLSHPSWFSGVNPSNKSLYWIILGVLSLAIGNFWYVFHRFTVHNLVDWVYYRFRFGKWKDYRSWLSIHIQKSFDSGKNNDELKKFVHFRSAQVILLFIVAEALILFSLWHENSTVFDTLQQKIFIFGLVIFFVGLIQFWIGFNLNIDVITSQDSQQ